MALVENIQRQDLDPIEIALSYERLINEIELTQEALSDRVGKSRSTIANYLRLLKLDPIIQTGMRDSFISMGHGRALINIDDTQAQIDIYMKVIDQSLSVRQTEALVREYKNPSSKKSKKPSIHRYAQKTKTEVAGYLDSKVSLRVNKSGKGQMVVPFKSEEDLKIGRA